jgi:hypothetical protein
VGDDTNHFNPDSAENSSIPRQQNKKVVIKISYHDFSRQRLAAGVSDQLASDWNNK